MTMEDRCKDHLLENLKRADAAKDVPPSDEYDESLAHCSVEHIKGVEERIVAFIEDVCRLRFSPHESNVVGTPTLSDPSIWFVKIPAIYILEIMGGMPILRGWATPPKVQPWVDVPSYLKIARMIHENSIYRLMCNGKSSHFGNPQDPILSMQFSSTLIEYKDHRLDEQIDCILNTIFNRRPENWKISFDGVNMVYTFSIDRSVEK